MKVKLTIAYEGTRYAGWQLQANGLTVQECVERAVAQFLPSAARIHSSSRTDAGVHAMGMVAHVEFNTTELRMPVAKLPLALNAHLPEDIRVLAAQRAGPSFHARFDASRKQYRYFIWNHRADNPMLRRHAWLVHRVLNLKAMRVAAKHLLGTHDFVSFAGTRNYQLDSTVRTVFKCDIRRSGPLLIHVIEANGFLYKMCRGIVGTLVQIGAGKYNPDSIQEMLKKKDRRVAGMTAPAHGLVLWKVFYRTRTALSKPTS